MKRRFGLLVYELWLATMRDPEVSVEETFTDVIPWRAYLWPNVPQVRRNLDFPLGEWERIAVLLQQDLNRLCRDAHFSSHDRVLSLEWRIVLHDMTSLLIPIIFRHPHPLHQEIPHQKTALLQAYYGFLTHHNSLSPEQGEARFYQAPMVSWQLSLQQRFRPASFLPSLFADDALGYQDLQRLENSLAIPLQAYENVTDWVAEDAFVSSSPKGEAGRRALLPRTRSKQEEGKNEDFFSTSKAEIEPCTQALMAVPSWYQLNRCRPLYLFREPPALEDMRDGQSLSWQFLERTMRKWWLTDDPWGNNDRDYYRVINHQNKALWVYQEKPGKWYVHGLFA